MDNERIGAFIRMLRREKGLTQKDLAAALGITDRAVSKWERGISAPDIALLEPLSKVLEISVTELLRGGRSTSKAEAEQQTQAVLDYSQRQLSRQVGEVRRRYLLVSAAMLLAVVPCSVPDTTPIRITTGALTLLSRRVMEAVFSSSSAASTFSW